MPSLLSRFINPILNQEEIRIVEHFRGSFEADLVLEEIGLGLDKVPLVLALEMPQTPIVTPGLIRP